MSRCAAQPRRTRCERLFLHATHAPSSRPRASLDAGLAAQSGSLDDSFGGTGFVVTSANPYGPFHAVAVQSDGKVVASGRDRVNGRQDRRRRAPDGKIVVAGQAGTSTATLPIVARWLQ